MAPRLHKTSPKVVYKSKACQVYHSNDHVFSISSLSIKINCILALVYKKCCNLAHCGVFVILGMSSCTLRVQSVRSAYIPDQQT